MKDFRLHKLAEQLVHDSLDLQTGENLLIRCTAAEIPLVKELIKSTYAAGAYPHIQMSDEEISRERLAGLTPEMAEVTVGYEKALMDRMDACLSVGTSRNPMESAGIPARQRRIWAKANEARSQKLRAGGIKWCVCIYPTSFYANSAGLSLDAFEDYYFDVCCMDYRRLGAAMDKLKRLLDGADRVRLLSPGTDLSFSIRGVNKRVSAGDRNIPDGEVYTAPVKESVEGVISFNIPSIYDGKRFEGIRLTFQAGKVIEARANLERELEEILDTDEGARYIGEFAFGLNPKLELPLGITLFDEKIRGSIHLALGHALDVTDNGNRSAIHWDLVLLQTVEKGGGSVFVDGRLVRKDGLFVLPELLCLNETNYG